MKNKMIAMMCVVGMSLSCLATSVVAVGPKLVSGQQSVTTKEEAQKKFEELSDRFYEKRTSFLDWRESVDISAYDSDYKTFMDLSDAVDALCNQIYGGEDKNTLDEQKKLINEYEDAVNKCIKFMEDYKTKYEEIIKENQMSVININNEIEKLDYENKKAIKEELSSRKKELKIVWGNLKETCNKWDGFKKRIEILDEKDRGKIQEDFFEERFEKCKIKFFNIAQSSKEKKKEIKTKMEKLMQEANKLISQSEDFMQQYESKIVEEEKRKKTFNDIFANFRDKVKDFESWAKQRGIERESDKTYKKRQSIFNLLDGVNYKWGAIKSQAEQLEKDMTEICEEMEQEKNNIGKWSFVDKASKQFI